MLDVKFIRENKDLIEMGAKKKRITFSIDELLRADDARKQALSSFEEKRAKQNILVEQVPLERDVSKRQTLIDASKTIKIEVQAEEEKLRDALRVWQALMLQVPNVPDMSVPEGADDSENVEVKTWGEIPKFSFPPKNHIEILEQNDWADFERGAKVAGFRGYFLKNDVVTLNFALWNFAYQFFTSRGFSPLMAPSLVRRECFLGTGYIPQGEEDLYKTQDGDYLGGTAEVPTMGYYMDEVVPKEKFPIKFFSFSPCFRREAGSHGKDTKGIYRVHEFFKFEQVVLCEASHEKSVELHEEITKNSEEFLQALGIPYRVVVNCGGDLGLGQVKKYDVEAWVPSEKKYRETHSSSYFHDFQTRRLNIRYKDTDGTLRFVHSLNNTAVASPRILISILENYQQEDGAVRVPKVLIPFVGKEYLGK
ncbi:MAG: serine--tRNA ligase [Patescibacteria group bacterium]